MTFLPDTPHRVLVVVASRHGATRQIAETLAGVLRGAGLDVDVQDAGEAAGPAGYGAVVLGSAVYYGRWLAPARAFAEKHAAALAERPVWLFSSGPVGGAEAGRRPGRPGRFRARPHRPRPRRLRRPDRPDLLGVRERLVTRAVGADDGDFRDWEEIAAWAAGIADELRVGAAR